MELEWRKDLCRFLRWVECGFRKLNVKGEREDSEIGLDLEVVLGVLLCCVLGRVEVW